MKDRDIVRTRDVMRTDFELIDGLVTVADALAMMKRKRLQALVVKKRDDDDEFGLVLLTDVVKRVVAKDREPARVNVYEIMSKPVISVAPSMDIRYCARLFDRFGFALAPVVDNGHVVGVVDYASVLFDGLLKDV